MGPVRYDDDAKRWLATAGRHYLENPPAGALFAVGVRASAAGLFDTIWTGPLLGLCVVGRPIARRLPQDGTWGEIVRFALVPDLAWGTASALLERTWEIAGARRRPPMQTVIAYHDRTRHSGCIYRKAGMRKDGIANAKGHSSWGSRGERKSASYPSTPKRRWRIDLAVSA
jgi:hypothetical protein